MIGKVTIHHYRVSILVFMESGLGLGKLFDFI